MTTTILSAMLPVIITLLLGMVAAWHHDFDSKDARAFIRMALNVPLPLALFVGTVSTSRDDLARSVPLFVTIFVAIDGMYALTFLLCRMLRLSTSASALAALGASGPSVPYMGPAILGDLFGRASAVPIATAVVVINLTIVPLTFFLLTLESTRKPGTARATVDVTNSATASSVLANNILETIKKPLVWAPMLAFLLVLFDLHIPKLVSHSLMLLGQASAGVALFASGIVLAAYKIKLDRYVLLFVVLKNVAQPALVFGGLLFLGYGRPILAQATVAMAIPPVAIVVMLALEFHVAEEYAPSMLLVSTLASLFTVGGFIALTY